MGTISISSLILFIAVGMITFTIGRLTGKERKDNKRLKDELEQSRQELTGYRSQVSSHFKETALRVNALTENYRSVYEHLAQGAQDLCDQQDAPELMSELNCTPMLGEQTVEESATDQTKTTEIQSHGGEDPATAADEDDSADVDQGSGTAEISETEPNNSDEVKPDEPVLAAEKSIDSEQQDPGQKPPA